MICNEKVHYFTNFLETLSTFGIRVLIKTMSVFSIIFILISLKKNVGYLYEFSYLNLQWNIAGICKCHFIFVIGFFSF